MVTCKSTAWTRRRIFSAQNAMNPLAGSKREILRLAASRLAQDDNGKRLSLVLKHVLTRETTRWVIRLRQDTPYAGLTELPVLRINPRMDNDTSASRADRIVKLSDEDGVRAILRTALADLWEVTNELTRLRPTKRERFNVCIFGSARVEPGNYYYEEVKKLAQDLARMECNIVTGGGPGLMQAANEGASTVNSCLVDCSMGIRVDLPFEQGANPYVQSQYEHKTFFTRLHHFVLVSDAFVVVPGGIGTTLEALMVWQLLQVRHMKDVPLIFLGEMWEELVDWGRRNMVEEDIILASPEDFDIPTCAKTSADIVGIIREAHEHWKQS